MLEQFNLAPYSSPLIQVGDRYGRLTILAIGKVPNTYRYMVVCQCDCGSPIKAIRLDGIRKGLVTSCGCYQREQTITHGLTKHPLYNRWRLMMARCYNPNDPAFVNYGGRGIRVCDAWHSLTQFVADLEPIFVQELELDRIDNNGNYELSNVRFTTRAKNCDNRRTAHTLTYNGETKSLQQWAKQFGLRYQLLWDRIVIRRWSADKALNTPPLTAKERMAIARQSRT